MANKLFELHKSPQFRLDEDHFKKVLATKGDRKLVYEEILKPETGDAYLVKAGQVIRMEQRHDITNIVDGWLVSPDLKFRGSLWNNVQCNGTLVVSPGTQMRSGVQDAQTMATMIADEIPQELVPEGYSLHFWSYHCSPHWHQAGFPHLPPTQNSCHVNGMQGFHRVPAIAEIKDEQERKDLVMQMATSHNFIAFQPVKADFVNGSLEHVKSETSPTLPSGTGIEFYANMNVYFVLSNCPWGNHVNPDEATKVPVYISVHDTGVAPPLPPKWKNWEDPFYEKVANGELDISPRTEHSYNRP